MKLLHRVILRSLPGPFFGGVGVIVFLLLMQFLIKYARDLIGKGLPGGVIAELIAYNMAYIVTLAVPMAVFLAVLVAFARLSESQAYTAAQAAGVSLPRLLWPVVVLAALIGGGMAYFNNVTLPEANFRARGLWQSIRQKQPGFALQPGVFFTRLPGYAILAQRIPRANRLEDLLVFDYSRGEDRRAIVKAASGELVPLPGDRVAFVLEDGSVERDAPSGGGAEDARTERVRFDRLRFGLDLSSFRFERPDTADGYRTDRTMPTPQMLAYVDSIDANVRAERARLAASSAALLVPPPPDTARSAALFEPSTPVVLVPPAPERAAPSAPPAPGRPLAGLDSAGRADVLAAALTKASERRAEAEAAGRTAASETERADRYRVEIHKKQSIAAACVVFTLAGALLGLSVRSRRGGLARAGALAVAVFLFYWVTLVVGEKLTDREMFVPWVGQWIANLVIGAVALARIAARTAGGSWPSVARMRRR